VQVTQSGGYQPFESPDGRFLYFSRSPSDYEVWRVPVEGGEETPVVPGVNTIAWAVAPNGFYFVEYREASTVPAKWFLRLLRPDAPAPVDVMEVLSPWWASGLDIAPDGTWFAYTRNDQAGGRQRPDASGRYRVELVDCPDRAAEREENPSWARKS
jgi:hypothetical protein